MIDRYSDHPGIFEDEDLVVEEVKRIIARQKAMEIVSGRRTASFEPPPMLTLAERAQMPRPEVTYRIAGWQPANTRIILDAAAKAGKTTLIGNLVRSLVDGEPFLGVAEVAQVQRLVLLDFEMGEQMLTDWLVDQGIFNEDRVTIVSLRGKAHLFNIIDPTIRTTWANLLTGYDYLIADPLKPVLDALGLKEANEVGRFLTPFDQLLAEAGIPDAFIAHHQGHEAERSRGDSTLLGWPDVLWTVIRENNDPASPRYLKAFGRNVDQTPEALLNYNPDSRHLTLTGGTRSDAKARNLVPELVAAVKAHYAESREGMSTNQINDTLDGRKADILRASHLAENQGLVTVQIGARNARLHYPILTTGSGTSQTRPVPEDGNQSTSQETRVDIDESPEDERPVPTGSHRYRNQTTRPVPPVHIGEPVVDQSEDDLDVDGLTLADALDLLDYDRETEEISP